MSLEIVLKVVLMFVVVEAGVIGLNLFGSHVLLEDLIAHVRATFEIMRTTRPPIITISRTSVPRATMTIIVVH